MKKEIGIFIAIIFLSALFEFVGWFDTLRSVGQKYTIPASAANVRIIEKISQPYNFIIFSFSKSKYLEQLETQHAIALSTLNEIDALRKENQELKKLLGIETRKPNQKTIIGPPILSLAYPAVGAGSTDGVKENDMVLIDQVLVGTIDLVTEYQSKVSLLSTHRENRIIAKTESGVEGVIDGNGRNVLLTHIPRSIEVKEGERVVTSGQEGIEKNILVGTIKKVKQNPSDSTQTFIISQLVSFYDAVIVEVK
jgi:cell shape-determining protein MreC